MPNPIRYLMGRLRRGVVNRRRAPRYTTRVSFSVSILDEKADSANTRPPLTLVGKTRNLSESGLALIVPSLNLGTGHLNDENSTLKLMLDLPGEPIEIDVIPVRSHPLGESEREHGFLIGAVIKEIGADERARYTGFLRTLRSPH